jgi:hypothetical protein
LAEISAFEHMVSVGAVAVIVILWQHFRKPRRPVPATFIPYTPTLPPASSNRPAPADYQEPPKTKGKLLNEQSVS